METREQRSAVLNTRRNRPAISSVRSYGNTIGLLQQSLRAQATAARWRRSRPARRPRTAAACCSSKDFIVFPPRAPAERYGGASEDAGAHGLRSRRARRRIPVWPCDDNTASTPPTLQRPRGRRNRRRRPPLRGKGAPRDRYWWRERRSTAWLACFASPARMLPHRQGSTQSPQTGRAGASPACAAAGECT